jgi:hypothetical protein
MRHLTNALAYFAKGLITVVKSFMISALDLVPWKLLSLPLSRESGRKEGDYQKELLHCEN